MSVTLTWAPCKLAKHLEQRRQVALFVAQGPRDGEQLVGYRGGWQRDAQLSPCVECKRDILLHQADVEPGLVRQVEHETRYPPARKRAAMLPPMCPRPMKPIFLAAVVAISRHPLDLFERRLRRVCHGAPHFHCDEQAEIMAD